MTQVRSHVSVRPSFIFDKKTRRIVVQVPSPPANCLSLEGGGVRGTAYAGLAEVLEEYGLLDGIEFISGSSAGAIAALIIALGYLSGESKELLSNIPMDTFLEGNQSWQKTPEWIATLRQSLSVLLKDNHSLSSGTKFLEWLETIIEKKLGRKNATFRDLRAAIEKAKKEGKGNLFKDLYVTGTNLSLAIPETEVFSFATTPDMPLAVAVRISSGFPFVFEPFEWKGQCDLVLYPSTPDIKSLNFLPGKSEYAYIITNSNELFYVDKTEKKCIPIKIEPTKIEKLRQGLAIPKTLEGEEPKCIVEQLTLKHLDTIASITNHTRKGHKYSDGGLMENLPARIFDSEEFLPAGYGFNSKGKNPGVWAVKIDTAEEIAQIIWGIRKDISLKTAKEIATAIYNALSTTIKTSEVRYERMVIPLHDGNIATLQFSINEAGKIHLISSARKDTEEVLENYAGSAYEVKTYDTFENLLASLSPDEIDDMIHDYLDLRKKLVLIQQTSDVQIVQANANDPDNPTLEELDNLVSFLEEYCDYQRKIRRGREVPPKEFNWPKNFINIKPQRSKQDWGLRVTESMEKKLLNIISGIANVVHILQDEYSDDLAIPKAYTGCLHESFFERLQLYTGFVEQCKLLEKEQADLINKLGIHDEGAILALMDKHNIKKTERILSQIDSIKMEIKSKKISPSSLSNNQERSDGARFQIFCNTIQPLLDNLEKQELPVPLQTVLRNLDLYHPYFIYPSRIETDNINFSIDLTNPFDQKLYMVASCLYLSHKRVKTRDQDKLKTIFEKMFPECLIPKNITELGIFLQQTGQNLFMSAYRIEELMNFFELTENPTAKELPSIDLDHVLGLRNFSIYKTKINKQPKQTTDGIILKSIFNPLTVSGSKEPQKNMKEHNNGGKQNGSEKNQELPSFYRDTDEQSPKVASHLRFISSSQDRNGSDEIAQNEDPLGCFLVTSLTKTTYN